jgi:thymidylate synthase
VRTVTIRANTGRDAVLQVCRAVLEDGRPVAPRGQPTRELSPVHVELANPADTIPDGINRAKLLPAIGAAEALQNIAGVAMPELMHRISKFFPKPTSRWDEGVPTYGERMAGQLADAVECLRDDPDSREAVVSIWGAGDITGGQAHNLCTVSLQFLIRDKALDLFVTMRSNDAWYGLCYDLFQFAQVQHTVARCLGVPAGRYFHTAASMHLYERHWDVASLLTSPAPEHRGLWLTGIGVKQGQAWGAARVRAKALLNGDPLPNPSAAERWFAETLAPYDPDGR